MAFEVDQLDLGRVYVAGEDGKVRVFRLPEQGLEEDCAQAECILSSKIYLASWSALLSQGIRSVPLMTPKKSDLRTVLQLRAWNALA